MIEEFVIISLKKIIQHQIFGSIVWGAKIFIFLILYFPPRAFIYLFYFILFYLVVYYLAEFDGLAAMDMTALFEYISHRDPAEKQ